MEDAVARRTARERLAQLVDEDLAARTERVPGREAAGTQQRLRLRPRRALAVGREGGQHLARLRLHALEERGGPAGSQRLARARHFLGAEHQRQRLHLVHHGPRPVHVRRVRAPSRFLEVWRHALRELARVLRREAAA